jgi:hypothetical protein
MVNRRGSSGRRQIFSSPAAWNLSRYWTYMLRQDSAR